MSQNNQTRVVAVVDDMFFGSKIRETAKINGVIVDFITNAEDLIESILTDPPRLIIFDLNSKKINPFEIIEKINTAPNLETTTKLAYSSHVEKDLMNEANQTGFDIVMPRSRFVRELSEILS